MLHTVVRVVPVVHRRDPPGQPQPRWLVTFWGVLPFLALIETIAVAIHLQDMNMVGETIQQGPGQAFGAEHFRPLIERQIAGYDGGAALVTLAAFASEHADWRGCYPQGAKISTLYGI